MPVLTALNISLRLKCKFFTQLRRVILKFSNGHNRECSLFFLIVSSNQTNKQTNEWSEITMSECNSISVKRETYLVLCNFQLIGRRRSQQSLLSLLLRNEW